MKQITTDATMTRKRFIKLLRAEFARIGGPLAAMASHPTAHTIGGATPEQKANALAALRNIDDGAGRPDYWECRRRKEINQ